MDHFTYQDGILHAEHVPLPEIAASVGTPFYCYSAATLTRHYQVFAEAFREIPTLICFAVKANGNLAVLRTLARLGAGADTVSEGEIRKALAAGVPPQKIVFSGVGKTRGEMRFALKSGIGQFNVESPEELEILSEEAVAHGGKARVTIRVNPDVDAGSHDKISTGRKTDKFGVAWESVLPSSARARVLPGIRIVGVTCHIGSQLTKLEPFRAAFARIVHLVKELRAGGHTIEVLDLGGGLGIPYDSAKEIPPLPADYARMVLDQVQHLGCKLMLEPGRLIAGNAGILVARVVLTKRTPHRTFVIVDAGMNDLMRPSLYDAWHEILPVKEANGDASPVDVVGPVCETADVFGKQRLLPAMQPGDLLAFRSCGAYGASMASTYNARLLVPEVMAHGDAFHIIRARQSYEAMLASDSIPSWLE